MVQAILPPTHLLIKYNALKRLYAIIKSSVHIGALHICNQCVTVYGTENEIYAEFRRIRTIQRANDEAFCDIVAMFETLEELHAHPVYQNRFNDTDSGTWYYLDTVIHLPLDWVWRENDKPYMRDSNGNELILEQDVKND